MLLFPRIPCNRSAGVLRLFVDVVVDTRSRAKLNSRCWDTYGDRYSAGIAGDLAFMADFPLRVLGLLGHPFLWWP